MEKRFFSVFAHVVVFSLGLSLFSPVVYCQDGLGIFTGGEKPKDGFDILTNGDKPKHGIGAEKSQKFRRSTVNNPVRNYKIAPGVDYEQTASHGTTIHALQVDLLQAQLCVYAVTDSAGNPIRTNIENMTHKLGGLTSGDQEVLAGINGGFFGLDDGVNLSRTVSAYTPDIRYNLPDFYKEEAVRLGMEGRDKEAQNRQDRYQRMRNRFELIIGDDFVRIRPTGVEDAKAATRNQLSIIGGGGQLLPPPPASLTVVKELAPDPDFDDSTSRTAAGYATNKPNVLYMITVDRGKWNNNLKKWTGGVTIAGLANIVKNLSFGGKPANIDRAIAMDGGGSSQMWLKDHGTVSKNEKGGRARDVSTGIFVLGDRNPLSGMAARVVKYKLVSSKCNGPHRMRAKNGKSVKTYIGTLHFDVKNVSGSMINWSAIRYKRLSLLGQSEETGASFIHGSLDKGKTGRLKTETYCPQSNGYSGWVELTLTGTAGRKNFSVSIPRQMILCP